MGRRRHGSITVESGFGVDPLNFRIDHLANGQSIMFFHTDNVRDDDTRVSFAVTLNAID